MASVTSEHTHTQRSRRRTFNLERVIGAVLRYGFLIILSILFLLPFYIIVKNGLSTDQEITSFHWSFWPSTLHFENITELFNDPSAPFATGLMNSAIIAVTQVVGQLFFASLAGYGLARIPSRFAKPLFYAILATLLIPGAVTFVPTYVVVAYLGWVSTLQGLIVPGLFNAFNTFIFRQTFLNFPRDLEDAGRVDGLNFWGVYWRIALPNSVPIMVALGALTFIGSWNSFLWPLVIGQSDSTSYTVQVVLSTFLTAQTINLHELFIGAAIGILPLVIIFLIMQRYIVQGVTQTGIRG
ncbi:MAG TPA: carbohydrate ABC transporter permease [Ktedonobacteraceae bacterium]|jgi:multiple sugar transport system permease protein|nr:carbohydrate ABC transporter permease [Ktedonobacteraceae bacterium]